MDLTYLRVFFCRNYVKIVILCTVTSGILQVISKRYLKSHPELLENAPVTKKKYKLPRFLNSRGGAFIEIMGSSISVEIQGILKFLTEHKLLRGTLTGCDIVVSGINATAVSTYLRDAFSQNLPHLEKKKFILVDGKKIYLDLYQCYQNFEYLFKILEDETIPFQEKKR